MKKNNFNIFYVKKRKKGDRVLSKEKIQRINFLSRKSKDEGLTDEEITEQKKLRKEYLKSFRKSFKQKLDTIKVVDDKEEYERLIKEQREKESKE